VHVGGLGGVRAQLRVQVIALQAALETALALLNHFPLFSIMLKLTDPLRLPGGVFFKSHTPMLQPVEPPPAGPAPAPSHHGSHPGGTAAVPRWRPGHAKCTAKGGRPMDAADGSDTGGHVAAASVGSHDGMATDPRPSVSYLTMQVQCCMRRSNPSYVHTHTHTH
jgi:hypothetical protein